MVAKSLFIVLIVVFFGVLIYLSWKAEQKRREAYQDWATKQGWSYDYGCDREIYHRYAFLSKFCRGSNRYTLDNLKGDWYGYPARAFTFHYETHSTDSKGRRRTHHHYFGVVLIHIESSFPQLQISPSNLFSKIGAFLGFEGIQFESLEFSQAFNVHSESKRFAYDFCHTQVMDYLLEQPGITLEVNQNVLVLYDSGRLKLERVEPCLEQLCELRDLMPDYLFRT